MRVNSHYKCMSIQMCICACDTGWRRLVGSPKLQIIFHKRATRYRSLLRKITYKDKESFESSPPRIECHYLSNCALPHNTVQ